MSSPTLPQLRALVALADTLQFREAAARLGVSQPSVSLAITGLEACLGVKLAERTSRKVTLTPEGLEAAARARDVLAGLDHLVGTEPGQPAGRSTLLRLGLIPTVAPYVVAPVLRSLARRVPHVRPEVTEDQTARLLAQMADGQIDAAMLALPTGEADLIELPLYWEDFVVVVPAGHPLAGQSGLSLDVLKDLRLLLLEEGHCLSAQVLDICSQAGAGTDHPARAMSLTTVAQLVAAGLGATLLPATALPVETRKGKLAFARFRAPAPGRLIGLVFSSSSPRVSEFEQVAEYLRRAFDRPGFGGRVTSGLPAPARAGTH